MEKIYDVIVIGGGPAGYTSAIYTSRAGFDTLVLEKFSAGGQMTQTPQIDNYPGFPESVDGFALGSKMQQGAERFGTKTMQSEVIETNLKDKIKTIKIPDGVLLAHSVIIASGTISYTFSNQISFIFKSQMFMLSTRCNYNAMS